MSLSRQDEPQVRPLSPHAHECREQALVVLVPPAVGGVEQKRFALPFVRGETFVVDAEVNRADTRWAQAVALEQRCPRVLRDGDQEPAALHRPAVGRAAVHVLCTREELRIDLVLEVVDRRHRSGLRHAWDHHAERKVQGVQRRTVEAAANGAGHGGGQRHRGDAPGHRRSRPVLGHDGRRQPVACPRSDRRHERRVVELADAREGAAELASVRLRAAHEPGHEG